MPPSPPALPKAGTDARRAGRRPAGWRLATWGAAALLLLCPLVAMQLTDEVSWDAADFAAFGAMLAVALGTFELAARRSGSSSYRAAVAVALAGAFALVWVNLAVGIIGSEGDPANRMYAGVLAVGVAGALLARFRPGGMARALLATAVAQVLVGVIALVGGLGQAFLATGGFVALWLASAWLFRRSPEAWPRA